MGYANRWWLTYNGELYNFRELRRELEARGERFTTECDTEVVLRLYAVHGPAMLERLNGIYAFAIWDDQERRLFLARDRLGVKPLYYTQSEGLFAFASELRALLPFVGRPSLDEQALAEYLTFGWIPQPRTGFREIAKLAPGHAALYGPDGLKIWQWWDLEYAPEERSEAEWAELIRDCVGDSVRRQMLSDVPLGAFLSGGVDSSAVVAAMAGERRPATYAVGFSSSDLAYDIVPDDMPHARRVAADFGTDHHEETLHADVLDLLPKAVWHLEEPLADPAAISTYLICRAASSEMTVMLSGVGGDEIFGGYPRYLAWRIAGLLDGVPDAGLRLAERVVAPFARPGKPGRLRGPRRNLWKFLKASELAPDDRHLSFLSYYSDSELRSVLTPQLATGVNGHDPRAGMRSHFAAAQGTDDFGRLLYVDAKTFLPCLNLAYTDKMSMAASIEVRVPLLDDELVALTARIPSRLKLRRWQRKYVFKKSQEGVLPKEIIWRRKAGFGAPVRAWLEQDLAPMMDDLLSAETLRRRGFVDAGSVERMRHANSAGDADYAIQLYALLSLELWARTFLDREWSFESLSAETPLAAQAA
jgi:asparagine synthase (glutamine-hydrolysing)